MILTEGGAAVVLKLVLREGRSIITTPDIGEEVGGGGSAWLRHPTMYLPYTHEATHLYHI